MLLYLDKFSIILSDKLNKYKLLCRNFNNSDIADKENLMKIFAEYKSNIIIDLATQAGLRYSIENPDVYIQSNVIGFKTY